jgi:hypothetical protein
MPLMSFNLALIQAITVLQNTSRLLLILHGSAELYDKIIRMNKSIINYSRYT